MRAIQRILRARTADESGFTLIEMVVALAVGAIAFTALAGVLAVSLRTVAIQKTRTRANEIATQGIEDLQRFDYDHLGLCVAPSGTAPTGLDSTVFLANCTSPVYEKPCPQVTGTVPASSYTCTSNNIQYSVRRFVSWADTTHAVKRLAVFVNWVDAVGSHEVAQQSSLRSPDVGSVVGLNPPTFSSVGVLVDGIAASSANPVKLVNGTLASTLTFQSSTGGIPDSVVAAFNTLVDGAPEVSTLAMTTADNALTWSVSLPSGSTQFTFGAGTQYVTFIETRSADGKVNARPSSSVLTLVSCATGGVSCSSAPQAPTFSSTSVSPTAPHVDSSGALCGQMTLSAVTTNTTLSDTLTVTFETLNGPFTTQLASTDGTHWSGALTPAAGYRFASGATTFYFTAAQIYDPTGTPAEYGSTAAVLSPTITFGGSCP